MNTKKEGVEMKKMETQNQEVNIAKETGNETGVVELPQIDIKPYVGKEVDVTKVTEMKGIHGFFIKVETEVMETIERNNKEDILLCGSRLFGLYEDDEGKIGWADKTDLGLFLKKMKAEHYNDLVGMKVQLTSKTNKTGTDFLTFN